MEKSNFKTNKFMFSIGAFGRDMVFTLINMFLLIYVKNLGVSDGVMLSIGTILLLAGIYDAFNDPVMGLMVDNTRSRWGKFKPWLLIGTLLTGVFTVLLFSDIFGRDVMFVVFFGVFYLLWTTAWSMNDISFWSMLPALSKDSGEREVTSSLARLFSSLGTFAAVVTVIPVTEALSTRYGSAGAFTVFAAAVVLIMIFTQSFTIFGIKQTPEMNTAKTEATGLKDMLRAIGKNDQLLMCGLAMLPFSIGAVTTVSFGEPYFRHFYGDVTMFSALAVVMGAASIVAISCFPLLCKIFKRKQLFIISTVLLVIGYIVFMLSPPKIFIIGIAATFVFVGQSIIQVTLLVCLADIVEYGEYKLHKRNESVTFSLQAFISKISGAIASWIVSLTLVSSGINKAENSNGAIPVTQQGILILKTFMFVVPLLLILIGATIIIFKYKIDEKFYAEIVEELERRSAEKQPEQLEMEIAESDTTKS